MSSPIGQIPRSLAQLQRLPVNTRVALLAEALPLASQAEALQIGFALVEAATAYSETPRSGSIMSRGLRSFFERFTMHGRGDSDEGLSALVRVWAYLPAEVRGIASVAGRGRWSAVTGTLATDKDAATRKCVADLARGAGDSGLGAIACELLSDQNEQVAAAAESALCFLALVASDPSLAAWSDHASIAEYEEAARVRAQWSFDDKVRVCADIASAIRALSIHRREGVLWGAMLLLDPALVRGNGPLSRWVQDREQSSHSFLRGLLRRDSSPLSRLRAWQWLGTTAISSAAADRVLAARTLDEHEALLSSWHLMLHPSRLARLKQTERVSKPAVRAGFLPAAELVQRLSVEARVGVASLARGVGMAPAARDAACEPLLGDSDPVARLAGSIACSSRMLGDFCFDADADIARSSSLRLSLGAIPDAARSPGSERVEEERKRLRVLLRSPHEQVRRLALSDLEMLCDTSVREAMLGAGSRVALKRALEADRAWVIERLRAMFAESEEARSLALQLARKLGVVIELRDPVLAEIRRLLREPGASTQHARSLATAVAALREFPGAEPLKLLRESSASSDQRVRANAIDALVVRARDGVDTNAGELTPTLLEFKEDSWHRVRGSAVRGLDLLGVRGGSDAHGNIVGEQLLKMLEDSRPLHRLAGAWVADRTLPGVRGRSLRELKLWPAMVSRLRTLALTDMEPRVRVRCRLALARAGEEAVRSGAVHSPVGSAA